MTDTFMRNALLLLHRMRAVYAVAVVLAVACLVQNVAAGESGLTYQFWLTE
jgi:hypothetical protein